MVISLLYLDLIVVTFSGVDGNWATTELIRLTLAVTRSERCIVDAMLLTTRLARYQTRVVAAEVREFGRFSIHILRNFVFIRALRLPNK